MPKSLRPATDKLNVAPSGAFTEDSMTNHAQLQQLEESLRLAEEEESSLTDELYQIRDEIEDLEKQIIEVKRTL